MAIERAKQVRGQPSVIVLNTIKGKGVSFWAGHPNNHNIPVSPTQLELALVELEESLLKITEETSETASTPV